MKPSLSRHFTEARALVRRAGYGAVSTGCDWIPKELTLVARKEARGSHGISEAGAYGPFETVTARLRCEPQLCFLGQ